MEGACSSRVFPCARRRQAQESKLPARESFRLNLKAGAGGTRTVGPSYGGFTEKRTHLDEAQRGLSINCLERVYRAGMVRDDRSHNRHQLSNFVEGAQAS